MLHPTSCDRTTYSAAMEWLPRGGPQPPGIMQPCCDQLLARVGSSSNLRRSCGPIATDAVAVLECLDKNSWVIYVWRRDEGAPAVGSAGWSHARIEIHIVLSSWIGARDARFRLGDRAHDGMAGHHPRRDRRVYNLPGAAGGAPPAKGGRSAEPPDGARARRALVYRLGYPLESPRAHPSGDEGRHEVGSLGTVWAARLDACGRPDRRSGGIGHVRRGGRAAVCRCADPGAVGADDCHGPGSSQLL